MLRFLIAFFLGMLFGLAPAFADSGLPLHSLTPGATNPAVTQDNLQQTICVPNWTKTVRPVASYTGRLKVRQIAAYGYADTDPAHYEEDHLISIELGGHPTSPANLWPQPYASVWGAHQKDRVENALHRDVCAGRMPLQEAQRRISSDWSAEYRRRFLP